MRESQRLEPYMKALLPLTAALVSPVGKLVQGSQRSLKSLKARYHATRLDQLNHRPEDKRRKTAHKYPIPTNKMVANIMEGLPDLTVSCTRQPSAVAACFSIISSSGSLLLSDKQWQPASQ